MLHHRGQSVWLHTHGDVKKVASWQVKPYQIVDREAIKNKSKEDAERRQVMLKDGLQDEDNLWNKDTLEEEEKDTIGALNFEIVNSVSFSDLSIYTVKLHVSEHRKPEVKVAKM